MLKRIIKNNNNDNEINEIKRKEETKKGRQTGRKEVYSYVTKKKLLLLFGARLKNLHARAHTIKNTKKLMEWQIQREKKGTNRKSI